MIGEKSTIKMEEKVMDIARREVTDRMDSYKKDNNQNKDSASKENVVSK